MSDPFELLREQLVAAAAREVIGFPTTAHRRRVRPRAFVVAFAILASVGTASAAAVALIDALSPPLRGPLPEAPKAGITGASDYTIELSPDLKAGAIGWCTTVWLHNGARPSAGGSACAPARVEATPIVLSATVVSTVPGRSSISWGVVEEDVATLRLEDGRVISVRPSRRLPAGWKAAVWFTPGGRDRPPAPPTPLDAAGEVIRPSSPAEGGAVPTIRFRTRGVSARRPPRSGCGVRLADGRWRAGTERVVIDDGRRASTAQGEPFLSCASVAVQRGGERYVAAVLVSGRVRRAEPGALPGQSPRSPGLVTAARDITARRVGQGWLVVQGGSPAGRTALLRQLKGWT
jgi:hypothetical protein